MRLNIEGRVKFKRNTTAYWDEHRSFVPLEGEAVIYTDYKNTGTDQDPRWVPGVKIGDGVVPIVDLPFINEVEAQQIDAHIRNIELHIQPGEREFWNNKLNVNDDSEVVDGVLLLNRN